MSHTPAEIETDLSALGLETGDAVVLHASFKSLGTVVGRPEAVADALLSVIGESGTLVAPAFSYNYVGRPGVTPFTQDTPGILNGIVSETIRNRPEACRSRHPTHSIAAIGKHAAKLAAAGDADRAPLGEGSPLHILAQLGGKVLLMGVTHTVNSSLHLAESLSGAGYCDIPFREFWGREALVTGCDDRPKTIPLAADFPGCSRNFDVVSKPLRAASIQHQARVAESKCLLMMAQPMLNLVIGMIHEKPDVLLCSEVTCEPCALRRRRLQELHKI